MIQIIVSVKDLAAQAFGRPVFVHNAAVAMRSFMDEVNRSDSQDNLALHPADFELYELGTFDDSGKIVVHDSPQLIARAKDCKRVIDTNGV